MYPRISFLHTLGYVQKTNDANQRTYILTEKAFELLETPHTTPNVFISYRRGISTIMALLVESRLKELSSAMNPFVDKQIDAGEDWQQILYDRIDECDIFISLVGGAETFSPNVMKEIERVMQGEGVRFISIWHGVNGISTDLCPDKQMADYIGRKHAIHVKGDEARDYETALSELMNALQQF